jgi:GNAT superfamily N-acetyltransferase
VSELSFREGRAVDLRATFDLGEAALDASRKERGLLPADHRRPAEDLDARWQRERGLLEFIVAQIDAAFVICDDGEEMVGYLRAVRFGSMDELTELWVSPSHAGRGVGRGLLERCWPNSPTPELNRLVLGIGRPADLTLYTEFGVMPVSGHWHMRHRSDRRPSATSDRCCTSSSGARAPVWRRWTPSAARQPGCAG